MRSEKRERAAELERAREEGEEWRRVVEGLREQIGRLEGDVEMLKNENLILRGEGMKIVQVVGDLSDDDLDLVDGNGARIQGVHFSDFGDGIGDYVGIHGEEERGSYPFDTHDALSITNIENLISEQLGQRPR